MIKTENYHPQASKIIFNKVIKTLHYETYKEL